MSTGTKVCVIAIIVIIVAVIVLYILHFTSKEPTKSDPGPTGPAGTNGTEGATGPAGPAGPAGPTGLDGAVAAMGATGPEGPAGPVGPAGPDGAVAARGATGATGATGPLSAEYKQTILVNGSNDGAGLILFSRTGNIVNMMFVKVSFTGLIAIPPNFQPTIAFTLFTGKYMNDNGSWQDYNIIINDSYIKIINPGGGIIDGAFTYTGRSL